MRRITVPSLACALALIAIPLASAQARLDIGVDVPRGVGTLVGGNLGGFAGVLDAAVFPFPEAALHYQFGEGIVKAGLGARAFTFIVESVAWPNAYVEVDLGPFAIEAQAGGGAFLLFGLYNDALFGRVFFPDLSAWYRMGKKQNFRLGLGCIGVFLPDYAGKALPFAFYFGGKFASIL